MTEIQTDDARRGDSGQLNLASIGTMFVGGRIVETDTVSGSPDGDILSINGNSGHIAAYPMYVRYMVPAGQIKVPVTLIHGGQLSGAIYETTPDGRMGWDEYFVRNGFPVYVPDQVGRARSGYDASVIHKVKLGELPPTELANFTAWAQETAWPLFRFGPRLGDPFPDTKFPVEAVDNLSRSLVIGGPLPSPDPNFAALAGLADKLDGTVLLGHSESSSYPVEAALLNPDKVKAIVTIEGCGLELTPQQFATIRHIPILTLWGDHVPDVPIMGMLDSQVYMDMGEAFIINAKKAGLNATFLPLPTIGMRGNSHMVMCDTNNLDVADVIIDWIEANVKP